MGHIFKLKGVCDGRFETPFIDSNFVYDEDHGRFTGISGDTFIGFNASNQRWEISFKRNVVARVAIGNNMPLGNRRWNLSIDCYDYLEEAVLKELKLSKVS